MLRVAVLKKSDHVAKQHTLSFSRFRGERQRANTSDRRPRLQSRLEAPLERISMKAIWNGAVVAESDDTVVVEGNH